MVAHSTPGSVGPGTYGNQNLSVGKHPNFAAFASSKLVLRTPKDCSASEDKVGEIDEEGEEAPVPLLIFIREARKGGVEKRDRSIIFREGEQAMAVSYGTTNITPWHESR